MPVGLVVSDDVALWQMVAAGDWLQGPYVYYLYSQYGFDKGDIGRLFIAGFGSSMLFGTIVGSLADKQCVPHPLCLDVVPH
jgi:MFS transporter, MFS domain-containing protein family, molybdate-anion transporter